MARAEMRAAVSGEAPKPRKSRSSTPDPQKDLDRAQVQESILRPPTMKMQVGEKTIVVPLEYTIEDVLDRGVFEDVVAFARLVGVELGRMSPEIETMGLALLQQAPGYVEAALMRSAVRRTVRELLMRIAHVQDAFDAADRPLRPTLADLEQISDVDYLVCAVRLYTDGLRRMVQAKNAPRTASG